MNREAFVWFLLGVNRSGKSVTALEILRNVVPHKARVVKFDPQGRFAEFEGEKIWTEEHEEGGTIWRNYEQYTNTLFILDDYRELMGKNTLDADFLKLMSQRAENGNDFVFITHHPKLIIERLSYYITHVFLFNTPASMKSMLTGKLSAADSLAEVVEVIHRYCIDNPPTYPNFPYAYVSTLEGSVKFINMPSLKVNKDLGKLTILK